MAGMYPENISISLFGKETTWPGMDPATGKFTNGDFNDFLKQPSYIPAETINLILDNLGNLITALGGTPNKMNQTQLKDAVLNILTQKAPLDSPDFTGTPTAPTQEPNDDSTKLATTAFVKTIITGLVNSSPEALDTLKELADAMGNDPNFATTVLNALAAKAPSDSPEFTGNPKAPTPETGDKSNTIATTEFVDKAVTATRVPPGDVIDILTWKKGQALVDECDADRRIPLSSDALISRAAISDAGTIRSKVAYDTSYANGLLLYLDSLQSFNTYTGKYKALVTKVKQTLSTASYLDTLYLTDGTISTRTVTLDGGGTAILSIYNPISDSSTATDLYFVLPDKNGLFSVGAGQQRKIVEWTDTDGTVHAISTLYDGKATGGFQGRKGGGLPPPDYANKETTNRITSSGGTWTVVKDGYIDCNFTGQANVHEGIVTINDKRMINSSTNSGMIQLSMPIQVSEGDVVKMESSSIGSGYLACYFIPPMAKVSDLGSLGVQTCLSF